jgi:hypothetical protein
MNPIVTAVVTVGENAGKSSTLEFSSHSGVRYRCAPSNCYPTDQLMRQDSEWFFRRPPSQAAARVSRVPAGTRQVVLPLRREGGRLVTSLDVTVEDRPRRKRRSVCRIGADRRVSKRRRVSCGSRARQTTRRARCRNADGAVVSPTRSRALLRFDQSESVGCLESLRLRERRRRLALLGWRAGGEEVGKQLVDAFGLVVMDPMRGVGQAFDPVEVGHVVAVGLC